MITPTSRLDHNEVQIGGRIFNFLHQIDDRRRWRLWLDTLELAHDGEVTPGELYALLVAHVGQQAARAMLNDDRALALELLDVTEALLKHRRAALAFCAAVIAQQQARAADADEPRPREVS